MIYKQYPPFGAKIFLDICPWTLSAQETDNVQFYQGIFSHVMRLDQSCMSENI